MSETTTAACRARMRARHVRPKRPTSGSATGNEPLPKELGADNEGGPGSLQVDVKDSDATIEGRSRQAEYPRRCGGVAPNLEEHAGDLPPLIDAQSIG